MLHGDAGQKCDHRGSNRLNHAHAEAYRKYHQHRVMSNPAHPRAAHMPNSAKPIRPNAIISFSRSYLSCTTPPGSRNTDDIRVMIESSSVACAGEPVTVCAMSGSAKPWILDDSDVHESATNHLPSAATVMFRCPNPHHSVEVRGLQITPSISRAIACFAG